jgi:asparagine synthase (glutamine-hydrolysing)
VAALTALDELMYMTDDVLVKVDRTSMLSSLETRAPLLDHHVLEYAARLPFEYKLRGGVSKWVLREAVRPWLPAAIVERGKQGFAVPLHRWFAGDFGRLAREVLLDGRSRARGWLDPAAVERLLAGHGVRDEVRAKRAFTLVCLELWAQCYLDRPRASTAQPTDGPSPLHLAVAGTARDVA